MINKESICIIGSGNVAWHLSYALKNAGCNITSLWGRNKKTLSELSDRINVPYYTEEIPKAEIYIFSVPDASLIELLKEKTFPKNSLLIHNSGSLNLNVFDSISENYGVLYPLQTFSKVRENIDFSLVPILYEANNNVSENQLLEIANLLSSRVFNLSSQQRTLLHISAVFACNFVNHMYHISYNICEKNGLDFEWIKPLIIETTEKVLQNKPALVQTGPAYRNDVETLQKHIEALKTNSEIQNIYNLITNSIFAHKKT